MKNLIVRKTAFFLFTLIIAQTSNGAIDLRESSFSHTANDLSSLTRRYHSRSNRSGPLGFGWCFAFDVRLIKVNDSLRRIHECGANSEFIDFVPVPAAKGVWQNPADPHDRLFEADGQISRPSRFQTFDAKTGRTISFKLSPTKTAQLFYEADQIKELRVSDGFWFRFQYNPQTQMIERVLASNGESVTYIHNSRDLIEVRQGKKTLWRYRYDDFHNLSSIHQGARLVAELKYDALNDRVIGYRPAQGCKDSYSYSESRTKGEEAFIADVERSCGGNMKSKARFKFLYRELGLSRRLLAQMTIETNEEQTIISFDRKTGRALSIEKLKATRRL